MAVRRTDLRLLGAWIVARLRLTLRSTRAALFTFVFPLLFLVLVNATAGGGQVSVPGGKVDVPQFFTPSIGIYGLSVGCYALPIFGLAAARELGVLKRVRGTPLSPWVYLGGWLVGAILTGLASLAIMFLVAVPAFHVNIYPRLLPAAFVTAVLGAACLAAIGLAMSTFVKRTDTAPAVANLTLFPVAFLSGVFFSLQNAPEWVIRLGSVFPLSHLVEAFRGCFSPYTQGSGFAARDLAIVALWGTGALAVAIRRFHWETEAAEGGARPRPSVLRRAWQRG
jgi:ABC-2 type transport system permease protein